MEKYIKDDNVIVMKFNQYNNVDIEKNIYFDDNYLDYKILMNHKGRKIINNFNIDYDKYVVKIEKINNFLCEIINIKEKKNLYLILSGGLGNQLFMYFNSLCLSEKLNMYLKIYYKFDYDKHKSFYNYSFFHNINITENIEEHDEYNEEKFTYKNINIMSNEKNLLIKGYFQSYKYFENNYELLRKKIHIDNNILKKVKNIKKNKKIIGIHVRLNDYVNLSSYHYNQNESYYNDILNKYDSDVYDIILFSDDYEKAIEKINTKKFKLIDISDLNDEEQFYLLCICDVRICVNSSFSLMSCFINEIFKFIDECVYYFPDKWFGNDGPEFDMYDIIPINNKKFKIINCENTKTYGIFLIGTGKYKCYFNNILIDIKNNFLTQNKKIILISTDDVEYVKNYEYLNDDCFKIVINKINCRGFPADTMYRFEYFNKFINVEINFNDIKNIYDIDYLMFMNINLKFRNKIDTLSLKNEEMFFVKHPGCLYENMFVNSIEKNTNSQAYINAENIDEKNKIYITGAINGGKTKNFLEMSIKLQELTEIDDKNNVIAKWHDESFINYYKTKISNYKIMNYLYYCPSNYNEKTYISPYNKDHFDIRKNNSMLVDFTDNILNDLYRMLYCYSISNEKINIPSLNKKYNNSSRQGLLKNFFRIDVDVIYDNNKSLIIDDLKNYKNDENNILVYNKNNYELIYNYNTITEFINLLNFSHDEHIDKYIFNYNNHIYIHYNNDIDKFRHKIYKFIESNLDKKFLILCDDKNNVDELFKNFDNIDYVNIENDEYKIILLSNIKNHLCYNINDIYLISHIAKLKYNINIKINYFVYESYNDNFDRKYMLNNFNYNEINCNLSKGFTFIIRAKNESHNVDLCLNSLKTVLKLYKNSEIIFVDNNSNDDTYIKAKKILLDYDNTLILKYNINVPKCGIEHKNAVLKDKNLSLGTFYKWCYSFSSKYNVIKWDCDFLCIIQNLLKMIKKYDLSNTNKSLSVWFSGKEIYFNNDKIYINDESYYNYNEPRIQSKLHGFEYEDSRDLLWETPYTKYLIENEKNKLSYHYGFPTDYYITRYVSANNIKNTFIDMKHIYMKKNNIFIKNELKKIIDDNYINELINENEIPIFYEMKTINIINIDNLRDLDDRDKNIKQTILNIINNDSSINYNNNIKNKIKTINNDIKICVLMMTCDKYKNKLENMKNKLFNNLKYDYYFIKASNDIEETFLKDNVITVKCEECYENLPKKMIVAFKYLYDNFDYDYYVKIDDETIINEIALDKYVNEKFYGFDYIGKLAGGGIDRTWHFGKCKSEELNNKIYWYDYNGHWCGGGFGYIVSNYAVSILLMSSNFDYIYNEIYEDKSIGDSLRKNEIYPCFEYYDDLKISRNMTIDDENNEYIFISDH